MTSEKYQYIMAVDVRTVTKTQKQIFCYPRILTSQVHFYESGIMSRGRHLNNQFVAQQCEELLQDKFDQPSKSARNY